jgi:hypothetical protein|tara:strand:- start:3864 stop:4196 length:333 start_codon:yes stop_codon:yes gene_type:complete
MNFFEDAEVISSYTTEEAISDGVLTEFPPKNNFLFAAHAMTYIREQMKIRDCSMIQVMAPIVIDAQSAMVPYMEANEDTLMTDTPFCKESGFWVALNDRRGLTIMKPEDY